jgi:hypothetical protein
MFFKLLKEEGDFLKNGIEVNLLTANEIFCPAGEDRSWFEFDTEEDAISFFGIVRKE